MKKDFSSKQNAYLTEAAIQLRYAGFTTSQIEASGLPVELDGQRLCTVTGSGGIRYQKNDTDGESWNTALEKAIAVVGTVTEYMRLMESAPRLTADSLSGDYRLLADFNGTVLAGHPTQYGVQFITWEWVQNRTSLWQGHFYGPDHGMDSYLSAKKDFATRSGLIPESALFTSEQLTEVYRTIQETLDSSYPITDERQKRLESVAEQIERGVPDLAARVEQSNQKELELASMEAPGSGGMQFS